MIEILVLYYSRHGATAELARQIARGVGEVSGATASLRTVPPLRLAHDPSVDEPVPATGAPYVCLDDLRRCSGLLLGSPTRFGQMAAPLRHFLDSSGSEWLSGALVGKPAGVFTATSTPHGGQESTLLGLILPLLHHGMLITGIPFTEADLSTTQGGGSPYGASRCTGSRGDVALRPEEIRLARALGHRVAALARQLQTQPC